MCTYKITFKDTLIDRVRPAFVDNYEIASWMQQQLEVILLQLAAQMEGKSAEQGLSQRLRGIAHAPKDFDYKAELANRYWVVIKHYLIDTNVIIDMLLDRDNKKTQIIQITYKAQPRHLPGLAWPFRLFEQLCES